MALAPIKSDPQPKDLRVFGLLLPVFFAVFGFVLGHRTGSDAVARATWIAGAVLSAVYLVAPPARRPVFLGWSYATYPIGWLVSHVILGAVYFLVVTPIGLLVRLLADDPMRRRWEPDTASYWIEREPPGDIRRYFRQF